MESVLTDEERVKAISRCQTVGYSKYKPVIGSEFPLIQVRPIVEDILDIITTTDGDAEESIIRATEYLRKVIIDIRIESYRQSGFGSLEHGYRDYLSSSKDCEKAV